MIKTNLPPTGTLWRSPGNNSVYRFSRGIWSQRIEWSKQFIVLSRADQNLTTLQYLTGQMEEVTNA